LIGRDTSARVKTKRSWRAFFRMTEGAVERSDTSETRFGGHAIDVQVRFAEQLLGPIQPTAGDFAQN
jgi:hypothetical protein